MKYLVALTAFVSGFIILSLEIMGFRVLAPHFGYSIYVFGSLIGLVLFALAVGYWVGGLFSRRGMKPRLFFLIPLSAGLYLAIASAFYEQVLQELAKYGVLQGSLMAAFSLWAFPMAALATVAPYLVGMWAEREHAGHSSGWLSAVGTLGSLAGTFLTSFYFLPMFGTHATFTGNAYAAVVVPAIWLFLSDKRWALAVIVAPLIVWSVPTVATPANVIHAEESAYSHLEVVDYGSIVGLRTERRSGTVYSAISKDGGLPPFLLYDLFAVPVAASGAERGLLLGLGAGTIPRIHEILNPEFRIIGVELDPKIVEIGKEFFGLDDLKNIKEIKVADARPFLAQSTDTYDVIEMDIFRETEIPFYLVSKEFFEITKSRLAPGGIFMMNIYDPSGDRRIERPIANTAASVYPETYVVPAGAGSFLLIASEAPLADVAPSAQADPRLVGLANYFAESVERVAFSPEIAVFTDDRAPIEMLVATLPGLNYNR